MTVSDSSSVVENPQRRTVTPDDVHDAKLALMEVLNQSREACSLDSTSTHGFSTQLV